jgi:hypothetical protein
MEAPPAPTRVLPAPQELCFRLNSSVEKQVCVCAWLCTCARVQHIGLLQFSEFFFMVAVMVA